jgi:hypothetical protein
MFANPPQANEYLRLRFYFRHTEETRLRTLTHLVFPAHREDRLQLLDGFERSFREKALAKATDGYLVARRALLRRLNLSSTRQVSEALEAIERNPPRDYVPVVRYFTRTLRASHLVADGLPIRTEVWYGLAELPPPGEAVTAEERAARGKVLRSYYDGPRVGRFDDVAFPPYGALEIEGDITWSLLYVDRPRP